MIFCYHGLTRAALSERRRIRISGMAFADEVLSADEGCGKEHTRLACKASEVEALLARAGSKPTSFRRCSPEGRTENSPGLQAWERHPQGNRPERAAESALTTNYRYVVNIFDAPVPFPPDCARGLLYQGSAAAPAAFSVSESNVEADTAYISDQTEHRIRISPGDRVTSQ
jgi:hypothetical protein